MKPIAAPEGSKIHIQDPDRTGDGTPWHLGKTLCGISADPTIHHLVWVELPTATVTCKNCLARAERDR